MRLINADALMETINRHCYPVQHDMTSIEPGMTRIGILQAIQEQPTIEPKRKTGKWIKARYVLTSDPVQYVWNCSECGKSVNGYSAVVLTDYCPQCGSYNGGDKDD